LSLKTFSSNISLVPFSLFSNPTAHKSPQQPSDGSVVDCESNH
jgi:hypothetical protein